MLAPLLMWSKDLVRSRTLTCTGTSSDCPEHHAQAQPTSTAVGATGSSSGNSGKLTARLLLCRSPFADLCSDSQPLPLLLSPHCSYQANPGVASCWTPLKEIFQGNCTVLNSKHATRISGIHITKQSNYKQLSCPETCICFNSPTTLLHYYRLQHSTVSLRVAKNGKRTSFKIQASHAHICQNGEADKNTTWSQLRATRTNSRYHW